MLKLGEKIISDIYLGDKKIAKVFLGDKLVYQAGKPIFLDYVTCDRNCWIDTGIVPTLDSEIEFVYSSTYTNSWYFGCRKGLSGSSYGVGMGAGWLSNTFIFFGTTSQQESGGANIFASGNKNTLVLNKDSLTVNSQDYTDYANFGTELSSSNLTLFTMNSTTNKDTRGFRGNCYGFKVKESGVLIQDLRPCIDPKGTVCMYDMVTKKYFYNQGTGTLKAGGRFVESIIFDGASYINTGISYQDCTVECGLTCPVTSGRQLMGWFNTASTYWGITNGQFELGGGYVLTKSDTTKYSEVKIEVAISDRRYLTLSHAGNSIKREGNIGSSTSKYAIGALPNTYAYGFIGNLYFHRFISPDGVLIQDLRPYVDENGVACFKDIVTGNLFYNQGTGTLTYTEK